MIQDNKYNLRSNGRTLVVPSRSKSKYVDLRFKNFFANYVTLNLLASKSPFIDDGNMPVVLIDVL